MHFGEYELSPSLISLSPLPSAHPEAFRAAVSIIDSAAQKGVIHKNAAARKKSRLNANVNAAIAKAKAAEAKEKAEAAKEEAKEAYKEKMEEKA